MKTFRRDRLRRLIEAGRVVMVTSYHFDDMYGAERTTTEKPVRMNPSDDWRDRQEGIVYLYEHDLTAKSGACYEGEQGRIHLRVHSNSNFDLRIIPEVQP